MPERTAAAICLFAVWGRQNEEKSINEKSFTAAIAAGAIGLALAGCDSSSLVTHRLVATGGEHTVAFYPDEATFIKVSHKAQHGGVSGMVGSAEEGLSAKKIDDQTPVKILSSDSNGTEVQIVQGPMKGTAGFVANQNVD